METSESRIWTWRIVLVVATVWLYLPVLGAPFVFDDIGALAENRTLERLWPPGWLSQADGDPLAGRPLVSLTMALGHAAHGRSPAGYRAVNVALHVVNALLLFAVARWLASRWPGLGSEESQAVGIGAAVALVWSVHPLQTEAVAYISQRTELLVACFYLLAVLASMQSFDARGTRRRVFVAAAVVAAWLGALSKEVIVSLPITVLLCDRAFASGSFANALRRHRPLHLGMASSWLLVGCLLLLGPRSGTVGFAHGVGPLESLRTQGGWIAEYLRLSFFPDELRLSYPLGTAATWSQTPPEAGLVVALFALTLWALWRRPRLGFLGAWIFLILAPTSSVVPIVSEVAAERRMYLPLAAVVGMVVGSGAWILIRLRQRRPERAAWLGVIAVVLVASMAGAFGLRSIVRLKDYRDRVSLWRRDVLIDPDNPLARTNLGMALADSGRYGEAVVQLDTAVELMPELDHALSGLVTVYNLLGRPQLAHARLEQLALAHADAANVQLRFGLSCVSRGDFEQAVDPLTRAAALDERSVEARAGLATALARLGRGDEALAAMDQAIALADEPRRSQLVTRRAHLVRKMQIP